MPVGISVAGSLRFRELERFSGLQDSDGLALWMRRQGSSQAIDRIERRRRDVVERSPMIRNQVLRAEAVEKAERVAACKVAFSKSELPPRSVTDWQQRDIKAPPFVAKVFVDQVGGLLVECRITGEENGGVPAFNQVHVACVPP